MTMRDSTKQFSVWPIVKTHYTAMLRGETKAGVFGVLGALYVVPLALGGLTIALEISMPRTAVAPLLAATGLFVSGLLAAFIALTNLRLKVYEDREYRSTLSRYIGEAAVACLYSMLVALVVVGALVLGLTLPIVSQYEWIQLVGTGVLVAILGHLAIGFLAVARRLFGVYLQMFSADFDAPSASIADLKEQRAKARQRHSVRSSA
ncbi:hypothetical protein [Kocuria sp. KH4]